MWIVSDIRVRPEERPAGVEPVAIIADGLTFCEPMWGIDWSNEPVCLIRCSECGSSECGPHQVASLRRFVDFVVAVPANRIAEHQADPWFMRRLGVPLIRSTAWDALRLQGTSTPKWSDLPPLRWQEAIAIARIEAARAGWTLDGGAIASSIEFTVPWVDPEVLAVLSDPETWPVPHDVLIESCPLDTCERLTMYLGKDFAQLQAFVRCGDRWGLFLEPGITMFPANPGPGAFG